MDTLGQRLRRIRRDRRLSLDELAFEVGVTRGAIHALELDNSVMSFFMAIELANALDVSLNVLATIEEFVPIHDESIRYYSCTEASRMSNVKNSIIYDLARVGCINHTKIDGKMKFSMEDIQEIKRFAKLNQKERRKLWEKKQLKNT